MPPNDVPHFLIPTNFGKGSRIARRAAVRWAAGGGGRITLLHVLPPSPEATGGLDAIALLHEVRGFHAVAERRRRLELDQLHRELHPEVQAFVDARAELRQGELVAEILRFARDEGVDEIVLGAKRWRLPWRPSLASRLTGRIDCKVVVVYEPGQTRSASPRERSIVGRVESLLAIFRSIECRDAPEFDPL